MFSCFVLTKLNALTSIKRLGGGNFTPPVNNLKTVKAVSLGFCIGNFSLETFVPNFVSLTRPSLQILDKIQTGEFVYFQISGQSLIKENCHNSRISHDIGMKLGSVIKLD